MFKIIIFTNNKNGDFMIIRLGYVALSKALDITASTTITYTNYQKEKDLNMPI